MICPSHYTNNMTSLSFSHSVRNLIASRWVNVPHQARGWERPLHGKRDTLLLWKWMFEMRSSGMQQADLSLGIPTYSIFPWVPKKCVPNCQGALKARNAHSLCCRRVPTAPVTANNHVPSCLVKQHIAAVLFVSTCTSEKAGMLCMSHGRVWALWPFMSPLRRSSFEDEAATSMKNGN